ncbi:MAG: Asp-tRNA(Asn)/Glu-tRNA(Gln) amidotransferase subunit GatC [Myxococcales bacterium]|nr:Asp-tRNA(Asn)/Glu-tRNA(Gln) amidotransferase subunit GatC [Myxococcales bacterium]MCB9708004.1 Asp-tRNA(Asn)/Glu-tRNA(Gln) amidotransferase subunit GatC [Myxococcales bacterium]
MKEARITLAEVQHVAALARLALSPQELQTLRAQLDGILDYIAALDVLDVDGVEPTVTPWLTEVPLREDEPRAMLLRSEVFQQAPAHAEGGFSVPKVMDSDP